MDRLCCSTYQHMQKPGLEAGLVGIIGVALTRLVQKSDGAGAGTDQAAVSTVMFIGWRRGQTKPDPALAAVHKRSL